MLLARCRLALLAVLLPLTGCLDYAEELTLEPDGSGRLVVDFVLDMTYMEKISRALGQEPDGEQLRPPTREEVTEGVQVEGITVEAVDIKQRDKKSKVHLALRFTDLAALQRIEGFGDERRLEFYDEGQGKVRVVYSFNTQDVIPVEEVTDERAAEDDPVEQRILAITREARESLRFRSRVVMPGRVHNSNGSRDPQSPQASLWTIDKLSAPDRHARLGKGKLHMMLLVDRASLPFVKELKPLPEGARAPGD